MSYFTSKPAEGRVGEWIQTFTGGSFYPLDPRVDEIRFDDIVGSLSNMCRYGGHCEKFYSVAEHCVHVAAFAPDELKLTALLHDASEAYLVDVPRPIKPYLTGYYDIEDKIMRVVAERFGITWPLPAEIKKLDTAMLSDERAQNMAAMSVPDLDWGCVEPPLGVEIKFWTPAEAAFQFRTAFYRYGGRP